MNNQSKSEEVNNQSKSEEVNNQSKSEEVNNQSKSEEVNNQSKLHTISFVICTFSNILVIVLKKLMENHLASTPF